VARNPSPLREKVAAKPVDEGARSDFEVGAALSKNI
jgi:hypothetical protein